MEFIAHLARVMGHLMPNRVAPTNIWEVSQLGLTAAVPVYARKESGRYGFTLVLADNNATMVQDIASGDVFMTDSVVAGTVILLIRGRMAVISLAQV